MAHGAKRLVGLTAVLAAVVLVAACAGRANTTAPTQPLAAGGATTHSGHQAQHSPPPPAPLRAGEWFNNLVMPRPYTPSPPNGGTDDYRCFLVDPKLTKRAFLTGSQFLPQNADIVHHAIFFRLSPADIPEARKLDAATPGEGWTCFGGTGIGGSDPSRQLDSGASWVAAWAPGSNERLLGPGAGYVMEPGSLIIMQVHYNLLGSAGKPAGTDQSGIRLRLMDGEAKLRPLQTTLLPAPVELPCAPGESGRLCDRELAVLDVMRRFGNEAGFTVAGLNLICNDGKPPVAGPVQRCDHRVREAGTVYAVAGHMHLLGRSIKVELNPGTPRAQTLLDEPVYSFHDQSARALPRPVTVKPGDTYRVTCTHDATFRQRLPALRALPPRYVVWGDGTSDEMCLGIVIWSPARW
jgi:Copper type II ascorbate-dependent monooxygenase, C-terminal domain